VVVDVRVAANETAVDVNRVVVVDWTFVNVTVVEERVANVGNVDTVVVTVRTTLVLLTVPVTRVWVKVTKVGLDVDATRVGVSVTVAVSVVTDAVTDGNEVVLTTTTSVASEVVVTKLVVAAVTTVAVVTVGVKVTVVLPSSVAVTTRVTVSPTAVNGTDAVKVKVSTLTDVTVFVIGVIVVVWVAPYWTSVNVDVDGDATIVVTVTTSGAAATSACRSSSSSAMAQPPLSQLSNAWVESSNGPAGVEPPANRSIATTRSAVGSAMFAATSNRLIRTRAATRTRSRAPGRQSCSFRIVVLSPSREGRAMMNDSLDCV
jgi:hypothetical protein